jgi:hypothetical protein
MKDPARIAALIVQNGDIYEDALGPKYEALNRIGANRQRKNTTSSGRYYQGALSRRVLSQ